MRIVSLSLDADTDAAAAAAADDDDDGNPGDVPLLTASKHVSEPMSVDYYSLLEIIPVWIISTKNRCQPGRHTLGTTIEREVDLSDWSSL